MGGVGSTAWPGMRSGDILGIGVKILEIELTRELVEGIKDLAMRHYGNNGDASVSQVIEDALVMRLMLWERLGNPGEEVGEPITNWEPQELEGEKAKTEIQDWLFRRRLS